MGRRSIPIADHQAKGTYRPNDRHAGRADAKPPIGQPLKPGHLDEIEAALWDQVVPDLVERGLVGAKDTAELTSMCELWGLYRKAIAAAKVDPIDKEIRCAVTGYWTAFDRIASKFGLSSAALAGLRATAPTEGKRSVQGRKRA